MKDITGIEILKKLQKGETVYLVDPCESDAAFKLIPQGNIFTTIVKHSKGTEYSVESNTDIAYRARLCGKEITEEEYANY